MTSFRSAESALEGHVELPSILLVEDNEKDARLIQMQLYGQPYRVSVARSGEEAISIAQQEDLDLILMDILLPGMDGFQVSRHLKESEETKNIQIVAVTSLRDMENKVKGLELGIDDYLVKPINMHELRARINALINKKAYLDNLQRGYEKAVRSAITDKLTGLYNYAYFHHFLEQELKRANRHGHSVALILMDIDDFKQYNDSLGHLAGDKILQDAGGLIMDNIREIDLGARYGGEEFGIVLPYTSKKGAHRMAERIREIFEGHAFSYDNIHITRRVTMSMGVAVYPQDGESAGDLIENADSALYKAKSQGKNKVCVFGDMPQEGKEGAPGKIERISPKDLSKRYGIQ
jgi:diguanylate cyclase (GGDEF)-like protein